MGNIATHLLGLVQNDNRPVCLDDIDRPPGAKFITLRVNNSGFLALAVFLQGRCKGLGVDDHDIDAGTGREIVQLVQVRTVVDEEPSLFAVMLHKVVSGNLKRFLNAFTDSNTGHHHDKLAPAVTLVQLEHSLDVHISLAGASLHLDIQRTSTQVLHKASGHLDVVLVLQLLNILQKLFVRQFHHLVLITGIAVQIQHFTEFILSKNAHLLIGFLLAKIPDIANLIIVTLPVEYACNRFNGIGLILLYLKVKFHSSTPTIFSPYYL